MCGSSAIRLGYPCATLDDKEDLDIWKLTINGTTGGTSWCKSHAKMFFDAISFVGLTIYKDAHDFIGPSRVHEEQYIHVASRIFVKWVEAKSALHQRHAQVVAKFLKSFFAHSGAPLAIIGLSRIFEASRARGFVLLEYKKLIILSFIWEFDIQILPTNVYL
ncbi:hypothetical protein Tco_1329636 [Tanacetum coccineum]